MVRIWPVLAAALLTFAAPHPVVAQETGEQPVFRSPVLIIDQDRLFAETRLGARAEDEIQSESRALAAENRQIEADLTAEERDLTVKRAELPPAEFATMANEFDQKVQRIRAEQDTKARALTRKGEEARQSFFKSISDVLLAVVAERGGLVVLNRRDVFLSSDRIDITDEAIARVNATLGEGETAPVPETPATP